MEKPEPVGEQAKHQPSLLLFPYFCLSTERSVLHLDHLKPLLVLHLKTAVQVGFTILFNLFHLKRKSSESSLLLPRATFFFPTDKQIVNLSTSILKFLHDRFGITIEDFRIQPEETTVEPEEPLSARRYGGVKKASVEVKA